MDDDKKLIMKANLEASVCVLNHKEDRQAVNYFCQGFGGYELALPICQECEDKMIDPDWVLLYCMNCCESCWVYKPDSSRQYHYENGEKVKWMPVCMNCDGEE